MIITKLISIDTSEFGKLAKDLYGTDKKRKEQATTFIDLLINNGYIPFFSYHHIEEIINYENKKGAFDRWSLIQKFPQVARLSNIKNTPALGSAFDIFEFEVKHLISSKDNNFNNLVDKVKEELIIYSSGKDFVNQFEETYTLLTELNFVDNQKNKQIESITHVMDKKIDKIKLSTLKPSNIRTSIEVDHFLNNYVKSIERLLIEKGDPKLKNQSLIAHNYVATVKNRTNELYKEKNSSILDTLLNSSNVKPHQINKKTTVGDLGYLSVFNTRIEMVAQSLNIDFDKVEKLPPDDVHSWVLWRELDKIMSNEKYAQGSNLNDKYLAILALYIDISIIDKRVNEYLIQLIRRKPELEKNLKKVVKLPHYSKFRI